ncbi:helicase [Mesorhizobium sp. M1A.F.Ca.IN.020.03.2.1]|uniref:SNF2-related protein n=1 Tax=Mesorhizobium sp. M1A.F.Ca.IN.020.03.2.1 TaxID=2496769 RepID=UPI000FD27979|nr:DEAD/DEAH box helicase [Mesorhizobium sp. M1A.F.Ca.IN.020.03.2.1]RUV07960.1 helicase [Mesorhizobium sp. M1A.F.Ca.IN.020.03.2.1]
MTAYLDFLRAKMKVAEATGFEVDDPTPRAAKAFQRDLAKWSLRKGRSAIFANTGLGKTLMQLSWSDAVERHAGGRVLVLTPLAVAQQTVGEASKFDIDGVRYAATEATADSRIVVTNYDRFERFNVDDFAAIVLDESSIIKAHDSKTKAMLIDACRKTPFRLCCTATPAPNDWTELGNHSEFLGVMTEKEMLATFFVHDGSVRANDAGGDGWRLKRHAIGAFWQWVSTWGAMIRSPADIGYDEPGYDLPPLHYHQITVPAQYDRPANGMLFPVAASTLQERIGVRRETVGDRVSAAAKIVNAAPDRPWLVWCNLNAESEALTKAIPDAIEVKGSDHPDLKAERLIGFTEGRYRVLVSKPSIAGFGMNFQRCADMIFVGLNDSFEQLYQSVRRCWRFGQEKPVNVYMVASELEGAVVANLRRKELAYEAMSAAMAEHMRDLTRQSVAMRDDCAANSISPFEKMELPQWLTA